VYSSPSVGRAHAWGSGSFGKLGVGSTVDFPNAVFVDTLTSGVVDASAGKQHSAFVDASGALWTVGGGDRGQLGDGGNTNRDTPVQVISSGVAKVACGNSHTCALLDTGALQCFGFGVSGQIANGGTADFNTPDDVTGYESSGAAHVGVGELHTCLVRAANGAVLCSGWNNHGQLGDATSGINRLTMIQVWGLTSDYISVEGGAYHTCAVSSSGGIMW
jgi:alpha-tubulin suppressor-like RCC1 family protein